MKIIRKDGIIYERKEKVRNYDKRIFIRISAETFDKLQKLADKKGKKCMTLCREILEEYVEKGDKDK